MGPLLRKLTLCTKSLQRVDGRGHTRPSLPFTMNRKKFEVIRRVKKTKFRVKFVCRRGVWVLLYLLNIRTTLGRSEDRPPSPPIPSDPTRSTGKSHVVSRLSPRGVEGFVSECVRTCVYVCMYVWTDVPGTGQKWGKSTGTPKGTLSGHWTSFLSQGHRRHLIRWLTTHGEIYGSWIQVL